MQFTLSAANNARVLKMTKKILTESLERARRLINDRPASISIKDLSATTGLSESWLRTFARGEIDNPGILNVEKIITTLDKH